MENGNKGQRVEITPEYGKSWKAIFSTEGSENGPTLCTAWTDSGPAVLVTDDDSAPALGGGGGGHRPHAKNYKNKNYTPPLWGH
jgi:hypothetical protein